GQVMSANSGMGVVSAITLAGVLVAVYAVVGGLLADAITDVVQGLAVVGGLVVLGLLVALEAGGVQSLATLEPAKLVLFKPEDDWLAPLEALAIPVCGTIVAVELISRFLGARSAGVAKAGTVLGGLVYLLVGLIPVFLGLAGARLILLKD